MSHTTGCGEGEAASGILARERPKTASKAAATTPIGANPPCTYSRSSVSPLIHIIRTSYDRTSERGPARYLFSAHAVLPVHVALVKMSTYQAGGRNGTPSAQILFETLDRLGVGLHRLHRRNAARGKLQRHRPSDGNRN